MPRVQGSAAAQAPPTAMEQERIPSRLDGLELALWYLRPADRDEQSRVVLLLHGASFPTRLAGGFEMDGVSWMSDLAAAGYDVWALDFPGYGASDDYPEMEADPTEHPPLGRRVEVALDVGRAVNHIRRRAGVDRVALIGHSWGAVVAGSYAAQHPDEISRLVLFAPFTLRDGSFEDSKPPFPAYELLTPELRIEQFLSEVPETEATRLERDVLTGWGERWLATDETANGRDPASVRYPGGWAPDLHDAWTGADYFDPAGVTAPVLLIRGEWDTVFTREDAGWLFDALKESCDRHLVEISRATHVMHLERGRFSLYEAVRAFLAGEDHLERVG